MAIKASTGLRNGLLDSGSLRDMLEGGFLKIYSGTAPATADDALDSAVELCVVSGDGVGNGLEFEASAVAGILSKSTSQVWTGTNSESGVATFFRFVSDTDTGDSSTVEPRLQGTVNVLGADLNLSNVSLVSGAPQAIQFFSVALPTT